MPAAIEHTTPDRRSGERAPRSRHSSVAWLTFAVMVGVMFAAVPAAAVVTAWEETKLTASNGTAGDFFGARVALDEERIVVGAPRNDRYGALSGSVYVYEADGAGGWAETELTASDGAAEFGVVAVDGERVVVGAPGDGTNGLNAGSLYVYEFDGAGGWTETKLVASDGASGDRFGFSVAVAGDRIAVGAHGDDDNGSDSGSAYVYEPDGAGGWTETKISASDGATADAFGISVTTDGDRVVVGSHGDDDNGALSGSVYVYESDGAGGWTETKLIASDGASGDRFGFSVAVAGDRVAVGASFDDVAGVD
jgi:hypothetical protein